MDLKFTISNIKLKQDKIAIFWLGQAGFVIKDSENSLIAIDPYLSDCCERLYGFKRLIPKIINPYELNLDILIATHHHEDHFDIDSVPILMANDKTKFISSETSARKCKEIGISEDKIESLNLNEEIEINDIKIKAVFADHGELAPDAIGILLVINGINIYFTGDTKYCPEKMKVAIAFNPDIVILPINGMYGNMNGEDAAKLVGNLNAKIAIPCHFWTFKEHSGEKGDPQLFEDALKVNAPECKPAFLSQGEAFIY